EGGTDFLLDQLGRLFADQHAVVAADVVDDGFVELVAADAHAAFIDHAAQRDDADFGRAAADVDHHGTGRFGDRQTGTDCGSHRFLDQIDLRGARAQSGFANRAALDL